MKALTIKILVLLTIIIPTMFAWAGGNLVRSQKSIVEQQPDASGYISRAMITTQITHNEPLSNLSSVETSFRTVYAFMELMDCINCDFEHRYYFNGKHVTTVSGFSHAARYRWWSKIAMTSDDIGKWKVEIFVNGQKQETLPFTYYEPTTNEKKTQPIQQRIEQHSVDQCEAELQKYQELYRQEPTNLYYQFMYEKWGSRCL